MERPGAGTTLAIGLVVALSAGAYLGAQVNPDIAVAGDLLVELDAATLESGALFWENTAPESIGDFQRVDQAGFPLAFEDGFPIVEKVAGATAVSFNTTEFLDVYQSIEDAPPGIVGLDPTRSIEVWAYNPSVANEETLLAWGRRGGPNGTNMSFNYGTNALFGAVGHWGGDGPDIGWTDDGGAPAAGQWHHLVYTYDGETTRVYADGCLVDETACEWNSEFLGAGVIDTFTPSKITLAAQINADGVSLDVPLRGTLSIGRVRIHDGVLTPEDIQNNFDEECPELCEPKGTCECENCPEEDSVFRDSIAYIRRLRFRSSPQSPIEGLEVIEPAGATIEPDGQLVYVLPDPAPASFGVRLACTNSEGAAEFSWTVTLVDPPDRGAIHIAEDLLVELDPSDPSAGTEIWLNSGTLADFGVTGAPVRDVVGPEDSAAVTFNAGADLDAYQCFEDAPAGTVGLDPTRTIEAWVYNPELVDEETILAWGRRGGPNGTNMSFNYGVHALFGAVGHWGGDGPDLGWDDLGGAPEAGQWHHLVYTYDGATTRVYSDGLLMNSEALGAGVINTVEGTPITLAAQIEPDGMTLNFPLRGVLSLGKIRVHDGVLTPTQIFENYVEECDQYQCNLAGDEPPAIAGAPEKDSFCEVQETYRATIEVTGVPPPVLDVLEPAGATIDDTGLLVYTIPQPPPAFFDVEVRATNRAGEAIASWAVIRDKVGGELQIAGELFVDLDAADASAGEDFWFNNGTLSDFVRLGDPQVVTRGPSRAPAVSFNEEGRSGDAYQSQEDAPDGLVGLDPTRTIEVWVFNQELVAEETLLAWGRRGGPNGTNMSFNYGTNPFFGAVGHWGGDGPDLGWNNAGGAPVAGEWHHLVYTYDGATTRVYADGEEWNSEELGPGIINTEPLTKITLAAQLEADGVTLNVPLQGVLSLGRVRVHDEVLTPCQVVTNYQLECPEFCPPPCPEPGDPEFADTRCTGIEVEETGVPFGISHIVRATAMDDTGDEIFYTYTADNGVDPPVVIGPSRLSEAGFVLRNFPAGTEWTFRVEVDDRLDCDDTAEGAVCTFPEKEKGIGPFLRGDSNGSGSIDLTDAVFIFNFLFLGGPPLPCLAAGDAGGQGGVNLTSGVYILNFLFLGGPDLVEPHPVCGRSSVPSDAVIGCERPHACQ